MHDFHTSLSKKRSIGKLVALIIGLLLVIVIIASVWLSFVILVPIHSDGSDQGSQVTIAAGSSVSDIANQLQQQGLIRSAFGFKVYVKLTDTRNQLQAGEYVLSPSSPRNIVNVFLQGPSKRKDEKTITFIEGWNSNQMQDYLIGQGLNLGDFGRTVDDAQVDNPDSLIFDGKPAKASLEGYLFPDTYTVFDDITSLELTNKMITNLESKLTSDMREKIESSDMSFYEILTLASIVEKEVAKPEDRRVVAGIFLNRLDDDYLLQSDATVNFITNKHTTRPSFDDLISDSPYNTYLYTGLPPGPIGNPGIDAINAVLNPERTDYYYFLTTKENVTIFSKTNDEHLANVATYYPE